MRFGIRVGIVAIILAIVGVHSVSAQTSTSTATATATATPTPTATATPQATATMEQKWSSVRQVVFTWTSGGAGTATTTTGSAYDGQIIGLETIPGASGSAPTNLYDITITDSLSHDVLFGAGADRSSSLTQYVTSALGAVSASVLTLNISNAGDTKSGTVILFIR